MLKGEAYTQRLQTICAHLPEITELPDLRYRRILIPGLIGGEFQFTLLGFIAHALRARGAVVTALLCDELLPACTVKKVDHYESACTRWCHKNSHPFVEAARLPHRWYSEFISPAEVEQCHRCAEQIAVEELAEFKWQDIPLGQHITRSIESFFKVGAFDRQRPDMIAQARRFAASAMMLVIIGERALDEYRIDKVLVEDGMKIDWGVVREVARRRGLPVDIIHIGARGACVHVEQDRYPQEPEIFAQWPLYCEMPLTEVQHTQLDAYFQRRAIRPYEDIHWTLTQSDEDAATIRHRMGLPEQPTGRVWGLFPNISFDSGLTARTPAFATAFEWLLTTIQFFQHWPQEHLVIKIHPAEKLFGVLDPTMAALNDALPQLPDNVHLVPADTTLTAHDILRQLDIVVVYTSTVGLEAACFGLPVINVGGGWNAGRGFTTDVTCPQQYLQLLEELCIGWRQLPVATELARRFAYLAFFRGVIPLGYYQADYPNITALHLNNLDELATGREPMMDTLCRTLLYDELLINPHPEKYL
ncbi:MAG: hypothetical protein HJJLKODD_02959 [Phycisphaerae bacterium]|nr:hypothetical protein [Phycisphaerae bacterium]